MMMFNRRPGEFASQSAEDPSCYIVGNPIPDVVRLPAQLGGELVRVIEAFMAPEPDTGNGNVRHLSLEGGVCVAETIRGFMWYRRRAT